MRRFSLRQFFSIAAKRITGRIKQSPTDPRAQPVTLSSQALGIRKRFFVYAPPGHNPHQERLPVLYLFRSHETEWINPCQDPTRGNRTVIDVYEEVFRAGKVGRMILVFPGISSNDNSIPGMLTNFKAPVRKAGIGTGRFEDYFMYELMPYVEKHFGAYGAARGTDGFSLGGFLAVKIAAQYPDHFQSAGAFDGTFFFDDPDDPHSIATTDQAFRNSMFDPAFGAGDQRDLRYAAANNPCNLVRNGYGHALRHITWLIEYGPERAEPDDSNFYRGERLRKLLARKWVYNRGRGELKNASHTWYWADEHMRYTLPFHWRALRSG